MKDHCKDCPPDSKRPAPFPGPRCATHNRERHKVIKARAHTRHVGRSYAISEQEYHALYEAQGGVCFICRRATGATKRLAVEHDHRCDAGHPPQHGCRHCIRALVCGRCNRLVAFLDVAALCRAIELLTDPPARKML